MALTLRVSGTTTSIPSQPRFIARTGAKIRSILIGLLWRALKLSRRQTCGPFALLLAKKLTSTDFQFQPPVFAQEPAIRAANSAIYKTVTNSDYPAIGFRAMSNALVGSNRRVSAVVQDFTFFLPQAVDEGPWNIRVGEPTTGGILRQDAEHVLLHLRRSTTNLNRGIFVGTWSPHNWFHWTIDTLPSIFLARYLPREFDDFPILLPESVSARAAWKEPLDLVLDQRDVKILRDNHYTVIENLIWVDSPTCPGPLPLGAPSGPRFRMHSTAIKAYRNHILECLNVQVEDIVPSRRIFLARAEGSYRHYNQEVALEVAAEFGFEPVYLESLSFKESVEVMLEAKAVIGPHGAGWANALYCQPGTIGVMWTWDESQHDNWFANVGQLAGMDFSTFFTGSIHTNGHNVDPGQLRGHLSRRIGAA